MKASLVLLMLLSGVYLAAFPLIHDGISTPVNADTLRKLPLRELQTTRDKKGETKIDIWKGVSLTALLTREHLDPSSELRALSADQYQVLLDSKQVAGAILALEHNGQPLSENDIRLINPDIRDMFWIREIASIEVRETPRPPIVHEMLRLDNILGNMAIRPELPKFPVSTGWRFCDLAFNVTDVPAGTWFLWGRDGVCQILDYTTYLQDAVIILDKGKIDLKSPSMPGGMWISDLAIIQKGETVLVSEKRFDSLSDVAKLLSWASTPTQVNVIPQGATVSVIPAFSDPWWKVVRGIQW
jgi:hypothetical protein